MSKKSKRQSRKTSGQRTSSPRPTQSAAASVASTSPSNHRASTYDSISKAGSAKSYESEFNPDYSQTIKDLRRIGTLAGIFFLVLIMLSFFLR